MAEKFQALVTLGMLNSRMKDFYDLWAIATTFRFEGAILAHAIQATFERRATDLPLEIPIALTSAFSDDPLKKSQWQGFLRRTAIAMAPEPFAMIIEKIAIFVMPPTLSLADHAPFHGQWLPGGPWTDEAASPSA